MKEKNTLSKIYRSAGKGLVFSGKSIAQGGKSIAQGSMSLAVGSANIAKKMAQPFTKPLKKTQALRTRSCNLCNGTFTTRSPFVRFCKACKQADEAFRFHDWFPAVP